LISPWRDNDKAFSKNPGANITGALCWHYPVQMGEGKGSLAGITNLTIPKSASS